MYEDSEAGRDSWPCTLHAVGGPFFSECLETSRNGEALGAATYDIGRVTEPPSDDWKGIAHPE